MVPSEKRALIPGEPICWLPGQPISAGRNEEKWFPRKSAAVPLRTRFPWLPLGERARPGGMRKTGSFEKSIAPLVGVDSWTLGREQKGMRKSGSAKKMYRDIVRR